MKNGEGYYDPTAAQALRLEAARENLRRQYRIREGRKIKIKKVMHPEKEGETKKIKIIKVRVEGIYPRFVVLQYPAGYCECMHWDEFAKNRCE